MKLFLEWDYFAWGEALCFWDKTIPQNLEGKTVLELGGRNGGLSLFFLRRKADVYCTDITPPTQKALDLHKEENVKNISYEIIDASSIPYENKFDYIVFKSILGGIGYNDNTSAQRKTIASCYRALKPGGVLLFAENTKASFIHKMLRSLFTSWGKAWRYISPKEMTSYLNEAGFSELELHSFGFFSIFSRSIRLKKLLYYVDDVCKSIIPSSNQYIIYGAAKKPLS